MRLDPADVEAIARRVAELVGDPNGSANAHLVDAATVAAALGVTRGTVYAHKHALGGRPIGTGQRPRWRFDLTAAIAAGPSLSHGACPPMPETRTTRRRQSRNSAVKLLPIKGAG